MRLQNVLFYVSSRRVMYEDNNVNDALGPAYGGHPANMVAQMTDAFNLSQHYHKKVRSMEDVMHLPPPHALADEFFPATPTTFARRRLPCTTP
jgi:hypothetical protein